MLVCVPARGCRGEERCGCASREVVGGRGAAFCVGCIPACLVHAPQVKKDSKHLWESGEGRAAQRTKRRTKPQRPGSSRSQRGNETATAPVHSCAAIARQTTHLQHSQLSAKKHDDAEELLHPRCPRADTQRIHPCPLCQGSPGRPRPEAAGTGVFPRGRCGLCGLTDLGRGGRQWKLVWFNSMLGARGGPNCPASTSAEVSISRLQWGGTPRYPLILLA
jgi:hypothetical protein